MQYAVPMRQMHLIHRRMPDDVDVGVTRSEQAVEMLERSGCRGACFGAEALCIEPVSTKSQMDWAFVGEGRGGYNQVQAYNFVGENTGSYNKSESVTMTGWTMKPIGIGLLAFSFIIMTVSGVVSVMALRSHTTTTTAIVKVFVRPSDANNAEFVYDCATDLPDSWNIDQRTWCCQRFSTGCDVSTTQPEPLKPIEPALPKAPASDTHGGLPSQLQTYLQQQQQLQQQQLQHHKGHSTLAVVMVPYECKADEEKEAWSIGQKAWCCKHEDICPQGLSASQIEGQPPAAAESDSGPAG
mmetsp:Transcript_16530/g.53133  ORF Transcript_16530/g.53133 Transcript_16530/m.53133 type:complete len:297 (+) Transcript_16530:211-1101(+)